VGQRLSQGAISIADDDLRQSTSEELELRCPMQDALHPTE
jgi:hypothetical protein